MTGLDQTAPYSAADWRTYPDLSLHPILAAAVAEFEQHGYHGTTVRAIASRAQVTMPSLYYHYGNKEGILFALLESAMADLEAHIGACLEAEDDTLHAFENFISLVALHYTHRRQLAMLHKEFRFLGPEFRGRYVVRRQGVDHALIGLLEAGIAEGIFENDEPEFTSRLLLGMLHGILDWYRDDGKLSPNEIAERYARAAVRLVSRPS